MVGIIAHKVRQGVYQRGAAKRQGPHQEGISCPDTLAANIAKLNLRDLEALFNGVIRALSTTGAFAAKVTGMVDATDLAGAALLHTVVFDRGFWDGPDLWWLDQHGILFVVPVRRTW